jgi:hypothetical protein
MGAFGLLFLATRSLAQEPIQVLQGHVPPAIAQGTVRRLSTMAGAETLRLAIQLPLRNQAELSARIRRLYDPSSPDYHHYLSVAEFTERYGPTAEDYAAVAGFARSHGFALGAPPANRLLVNITGTVAQVEEAFHVNMGFYRHPYEDRSFYSPDREPALNLPVPVAHIIGLNSFSSVKKGWKRREAGPNVSEEAEDTFSGTGSGPGGSFLVGDLRAAYYGGTALAGAGQCVGMYELGGYDPADVTASFHGVPYTVPVNNVLIDGAIAGVSPGDDDIEQVMDIVAAIGMAPGMTQVRVYIGPPDAWGDVNVINSMAGENQCKQLSSSYSWSNPDYIQDNGVFQEFAVQGQTFLNCTLDDGSYGTSFPFTYPQDDIWVTAVGGTDLITSGPGGSWVSESAWTQSGGGVSMNGFGIPDWQVPAINSSNGGSPSLRNVPDLAAEGNTDNYLCYTSSGSQGCANGWGGTSIATPRWAGFLALVNQQSVAHGLATVGYFNPLLYSLGMGSGYHEAFHDIVSGNNDCCAQPVYYDAVEGYDLVTGWGSPKGQSTIDASIGASSPSPSFIIQNSPGDLPLAPGSSYSTTLTVSSVNGFAGPVALSAATLPEGVTATFSPATVAVPAKGQAAATVTWTIAARAPLGTGEASLTATSGTVKETVPVTFTVGPPTTLQVSAATLEFGSVPVGATGSGGVVFLDNRGTTMAVFGSDSAVTSNGAFQVTQNNCAPTLLPGKDCQIYLSFAPSASGTTTGTLTISDNASGSPQTVSLVGSGGPGSMTLSAPGLQFGEFPAGTLGNFFQLDVINHTAQTVTFPSPIATSGPFLELDDCLPSLLAGAYCWITEEFQPVALGPATGNVTVFNSATNAPLTATLSGFGGAHTVMLYPPVNVIRNYPPKGGVTFGYQTEGVPSVPQLVTLFNGTSKALSISHISASGNFAETNNCASPLAVYASCIIQVTFTPAAPGAAAGTLAVVDSDSTSPQTLALSGTGIVASDGTITINPSSYDYGNVPTNNWTNWQSFTLTNNGTQPVTIQNASATGPFSSYKTCVGTLAPGANCSFAANGITGVLGKVNGELLITDSAGNHFVPLSLTGVPQTVSLSPVSLNFGYQTPNTRSASQPVTLLNNLPNNLVITSVSTTGPFTETNNCGGKLSAWGQTCTINVTFSPTANGTASGTLSVTDTNSNTRQTVALTGIGGVPPGFSLSATSASVAASETGASTVTVTIANGYNTPVTFTASGLPSGVTASFNPASLAGPGTSTLTFTATSAAPVGAYTITVTGTPSSGAVKTTTLSLAVNPVPSFALSATSACVSRGSTGASTVAETIVSGYNQNVTFTVSGLPSGVTASFSPASLAGAGTSALTFTATSAAPVGAYTITVTGTPSSGAAHTSTLTLAVSASPCFLLYAAGAAVTTGSTGVSTVTETVSGGYSNNVTFTASGLPSGVTASFSPASLNGAGTSALTFTATPAAAVGAHTITVNGTPSSGAAQTITLTLTVNPPFALSATGATVATGAAATSTVTETTSNGYNTKVALTASGLPSGVTAAFSPASLTGAGTSMLTFTAAPAAAPGTYTITLTGTPLTGRANSTTLILTVNNISSSGNFTAADQFTYTSSFSSKAGNLHATLAASPGTTWRFSLINVGTNSGVTEVDGSAPLSISLSVPAGTYEFFVEVTSGSGAWTISGIHP